MKLYYTATSPFVRKVLVVAHELGIADRIQTEFLRPSPTTLDPVLAKANPLSKIPALVLEDGTTLFDSPLLCEYLMTLSDRVALVPSSGAERFRVLRQQALCDGILEAAMLVFHEHVTRPKELAWEPWITGQRDKALQGLDALEQEFGDLGRASSGAEDDVVDLGRICVAVTLGWLEFRNPIADLRPSRPHLFGWYDRFRRRASMTATEPHL